MHTPIEVKIEIAKFINLFHNKVANIHEIKIWLNSFKDVMPYFDVQLKKYPVRSKDRYIFHNFSTLYETLQAMATLHKKEAKLKVILDEYYPVKDSILDVLRWTYKHQEIGHELDLQCYYADYLDYAEECYELSPYLGDLSFINFKVNPKDFEIIKEFIDIFNHNYMKLIYRRMH